MPYKSFSKERNAGTTAYVRRSQVYKRLRSRKLAEGHYLVEHEPSQTEFYIFKRAEDWAVAGRQEKLLRGGFRKKDDIMELLAQHGPRALAAAS